MPTATIFSLDASDGEIALLIDDTVEMLPGVLRGMLQAIMGQPSVGIVGAEVLLPDGMVFHSGVSFDFGRRERQPYRRGNSWMVDETGGGQQQAEEGGALWWEAGQRPEAPRTQEDDPEGVEGIMAFHAHMGMPCEVAGRAHSKAAAGLEDRASEDVVRVNAVWEGIMAVRTSMLRIQGGFNAVVKNGMVGAEMCLRAAAGNYQVLMYRYESYATSLCSCDTRPVAASRP